tara:strand:+ start:922 stop:1677 length:756 start_codon:yes stop_codon:yes gene_type:complete
LSTEKNKKNVNGFLLNKIMEIKQVMPYVGVRKLHYMLRQSLLESGYPILGRDRLFDLLRERDMLVKRIRNYAITTDSNHPFKIYDNLIKTMNISRVNQLWVSDITYVRVNHKFCYLSLVTDVFSRKIVGYHLNESLKLEGPLKALQMALKEAKPEYHHSDRGSQYCSYRYTNELKKYNVKISMTQDGNCYDNAVAERVNGILKQEFDLSNTFKSKKEANKLIKQAVHNYNFFRPHWGLDLKVPGDVYIYAA